MQAETQKMRKQDRVNLSSLSYYLCALHVAYHFLSASLWQNSPPRVQKMAVLDESKFDRETIHGAPSPMIQQLLLVDSLRVPNTEALALQRSSYSQQQRACTMI